MKREAWRRWPLLVSYLLLAVMLGVFMTVRDEPASTNSPSQRKGTALNNAPIEDMRELASAAMVRGITAIPRPRTNVAAAPPVAVGKPGPGFGVSFSDTLPWLEAGELDAQLKDVSALGFTWIRMDFDWQNMQPDSADSFNFSEHDRVVKAAAKYKLQVLGLITMTPPWARPAGCSSSPACAPADNDQFARFAGALAAHYGPLGVTHWEIWNEPNIEGGWLPKPDAHAYTVLLKKSYTAIKAANMSAIVLSGGISSVDESSGSINQLTFLESMYAFGAKGSFDALGYHSYSYPATPDERHAWSGWSMMSDTHVSLRSIMVANGDSTKQIWSTEYGAPTNGPGHQATETGYDPSAGTYYVSEGLQATMAAQAITKTKASSWAGPLFWYGYKDIGTDASDSENFFGLLRMDGTRKASYTAFQTLLK